jgi:hypothetical protein
MPLEFPKIDPLCDSAYARKIAGNKRRETLSRWVASGIFLKADRVINGRNFWYQSTLRAWAESDPRVLRAQAEDREAEDAEADRVASDDDEDDDDDQAA